MDEWVKGWLASENAQRDVIAVKRIYVDINDGDLIDGIMFSQIMFWHGFNLETGKPRMTIQRDGELWLAKRAKDWWDECRITERYSRDCIKRLAKRGLIIVRTWKFNDVPTTHLRINWPEFKNRVQSILQNPQIGFDENRQMDLTKIVKSITESTTEITTKNRDSLPAAISQDDFRQIETVSPSGETGTDPSAANEKNTTAVPAAKGRFTASKYYPVNEAKQEVYAKTYTPKDYAPLLEAWAKHGIVPVKGSVLNADAKYATYKLTKPPAKRSPTFDAIAECGWHMRPGFSPEVLNGNAGRVGKVITCLAEHLGKTYNEVNEDAMIAQRVRAVYAQWKVNKPNADPPKDPAAFISAWEEFTAPAPARPSQQPAPATREISADERAELARKMAEKKATLFS
jgi:hypothetical protein